MTKEEFIKKYHKTKTLKFEPPTFEEFVATKSENNFAHWFSNNVSIIMTEKTNQENKNYFIRDENNFEVYNE